MQTLERVDAKETKSKAAERTPAEKAFLKTQEKRVRICTCTCTVYTYVRVYMYTVHEFVYSHVSL